MRKSNLRGLLLLTSSLLVLLLAGCKGKDEPTNKDLAGGKSAKVTFQLSLPQGEAFTYRNAIHDAEEWKVKKLFLYTFSADGTKLLAKDTLDMSLLIASGNAQYSYTKEFDENNVGVYRFVFLANDEIAGATVGSTSLADFEKMLMTKVLSDNGTSKDLLTGENSELTIPMTGMAKQGNSTQIAVTGTTSPVQVVLTRVVARIDVANHIPNLTITGLSLKNTYNKTSVFPTKDNDGNKTYQAPTGATKVTMSAGYADLPNPFKGVAGDEGKLLKKAFYLYEGPQPTEEAQQDNATTIEVKGTLENGRQVVYTIPFVRSSVNYSPLTVKRNYLYRLILGDNTPLEPDSKVIFTIEDTPWNSVILNHEMQIIEVICWAGERSTNHYDSLNRIFYTRYFDEYKFELRTKLEGHNKFTIKMIHSDSGGNYSIKEDQEEKDKFFIVFPKLDTEIAKDKAIFEIYSDVAPDVKCFITIIFDKNYLNPAFN